MLWHCVNILLASLWNVHSSCGSWRSFCFVRRLELCFYWCTFSALTVRAKRKWSEEGVVISLYLELSWNNHFQDPRRCGQSTPCPSKSWHSMWTNWLGWVSTWANCARFHFLEHRSPTLRSECKRLNSAAQKTSLFLRTWNIGTRTFTHCGTIYRCVSTGKVLVECTQHSYAQLLLVGSSALRSTFIRIFQRQNVKRNAKPIR